MNLGRDVRDGKGGPAAVCALCSDSGAQLIVRIYLSELLQHQWNSSYLHLACTLPFSFVIMLRSRRAVYSEFIMLLQQAFLLWLLFEMSVFNNRGTSDT